MRVVVLDLLCAVPYYCGYLCRSLQSSGADVTLASTRYYLDPGFFSRHRVRNDPGLLDLVARFHIRRPLLRQALRFVEALVNLTAWAVRFTLFRPQILHVQYLSLLLRGVGLEIWFLKFVHRLGIKIVYTVHDAVVHDLNATTFGPYEAVYRMADALICHNEVTKDRLIRELAIPPDRLWVIPHGPLFGDAAPMSENAARAALGLPENECLVLWQGIIKDYKGLPYLLESWREFRRRRVPARLLVVGTGKSRLVEETRETVRRLEIGDSVTLVLEFVPVDRLVLYYRAADVLVYPYKAITTSGALMTGVAFGKAIVTTTLPSFEEELQHDSNALLVPYGDSVAMAGAIERLVTQPEERRRLGAAAALVSTRNSWEAIAAATVHCYQETVRESRAPRNSTKISRIVSDSRKPR